MSDEILNDVPGLDSGYAAGFKFYTVSDDSLVSSLVDSISIESLNLSLAGIFDGYSVILFNEWASRAGPFTYSYALYQLIYERAKFDLEDIVEKFGEDGLYLLLSLPFMQSVSPEEEIAANELLEAFFNEIGLLEDYRKTLRELTAEANRKNRPAFKVYPSFIAHILNKALNELVLLNERRTTLDI